MTSGAQKSVVVVLVEVVVVVTDSRFATAPFTSPSSWAKQRAELRKGSPS
jgi:hypothetical protein